MFTNTQGSATSVAATVTVKPAPPVITSGPTSLTVRRGHPAEFKVTATGTGPLCYQWSVKLAGTTTWLRVPGAITPRFALPGLWVLSGTQVRVEVRNVAGTVVSSAATVTVTK